MESFGRCCSLYAQFRGFEMDWVRHKDREAAVGAVVYQGESRSVAVRLESEEKMSLQDEQSMLTQG